MLPIPPTLRTQFEAYLHAQGVPKMEQAAYAKWLRYYLDFCHKYHFPPQQRGSLAPFLQKLEEKNQTKAQRQQASDGITHYYELLRSTASPSDGPPPQTVSPPGKIPDGFNALLFFYRYVLNKEFGKIEGVVRAKRKPYIPVVLSREEIDAILKHLFLSLI